jgi:hypothetical protein
MTIDVERGPWPALIERAQAITDRLATDEADSRRRLGFLAYHPQRLIEMLKGSRKLSVAEYEALAEAWYYRFGELLPTEDGTDREPPRPSLSFRHLTISLRRKRPRSSWAFRSATYSAQRRTAGCRSASG